MAVLNMLDSIWDWIIFIAVVLILFGGANKIPELARGLGRAVGEFRKAQMEMEREISNMSRMDQQNSGQAAQPPAQPEQNAAKTREEIEKRIAELESEIKRLKRLLEES